MDLNDSFRHQGMRKKLVAAIRERGISDENVLHAMEKIPRHLFAFDSAFVERAYEDTAFPIGEGQTISQPYTVAYQSVLLNVKRGDKILEVGTGSGFQAIPRTNRRKRPRVFLGRHRCLAVNCIIDD